MGDKDYSGTPLPKKLGMNGGSRVALVDAPPGFRRTLMPLPPGVRFSEPATSGAYDVIVVFSTQAAKLRGTFARLKRFLAPAGGLWVAYPKKSSGVATDLTFEEVQRIGLAAGLVDNKSCAVYETWSGVRFVYRLKDRPLTSARRLKEGKRSAPKRRE